MHEGKLRFFTAEGQLILTAEERLMEVEQELERLRSQLKAQGMQPET